MNIFVIFAILFEATILVAHFVSTYYFVDYDEAPGGEDESTNYHFLAFEYSTYGCNVLDTWGKKIVIGNRFQNHLHIFLYKGRDAFDNEIELVFGKRKWVALSWNPVRKMGLRLTHFAQLPF
jgi:hypothetical protein